MGAGAGVCDVEAVLDFGLGNVGPNAALSLYAQGAQALLRVLPGLRLLMETLQVPRKIFVLICLTGPAPLRC